MKTLTGGKFEIEAELSTTIAECKKIVEADKGFPAAGMKLICDGKVLKDDVTLEAAGIKPGSFLVCFVSKKAKAKKPAPAPAPAPQQVTMTGDGSGGSSSSNTESTSTTAPAPTTATSAPSSNESTATENAQSTSEQGSTTPSDATGAQQVTRIACNDGNTTNSRCCSSTASYGNYKHRRGDGDGSCSRCLWRR